MLKITKSSSSFLIGLAIAAASFFLTSPASAASSVPSVGPARCVTCGSSSTSRPSYTPSRPSYNYGLKRMPPLRNYSGGGGGGGGGGSYRSSRGYAAPCPGCARRVQSTRLNNHGLALSKSGNYAGANKFYRAAVKANPRNLTARSNLVWVQGKSASRNKDYRTALAKFRQAQRMKPTFERARTIANLERLAAQSGVQRQAASPKQQQVRRTVPSRVASDVRKRSAPGSVRARQVSGIRPGVNRQRIARDIERKLPAQQRQTAERGSTSSPVPPTTERGSTSPGGAPPNLPMESVSRGSTSPQVPPAGERGSTTPASTPFFGQRAVAPGVQMEPAVRGEGSGSGRSSDQPVHAQAVATADTGAAARVAPSLERAHELASCVFDTGGTACKTSDRGSPLGPQTSGTPAPSRMVLGETSKESPPQSTFKEIHADKDFRPPSATPQIAGLPPVSSPPTFDPIGGPPPPVPQLGEQVPGMSSSPPPPPPPGTPSKKRDSDEPPVPQISSGTTPAPAPSEALSPPEMPRRVFWRTFLDNSCINFRGDKDGGTARRQQWEDWLTEHVKFEKKEDPGNVYGIHMDSHGRVLVTRGWLDKADGTINDLDVNTFELGKALYFLLSAAQQRESQRFMDAHDSWLADMKRTPSRGNGEPRTKVLGDFAKAEEGFGHAFRAVACDVPGNNPGRSMVSEALAATR
jgi:hypothetical protein